MRTLILIFFEYEPVLPKSKESFLSSQHHIILQVSHEKDILDQVSEVVLEPISSLQVIFVKEKGTIVLHFPKSYGIQILPSKV